MLKLAAALWMGLAAAAHAQSWPTNYVGQFCGLSTLNDSSQIGDCETPDAQNVMTDNGGMEKRTGNVRIAQILNGYAVQFVADFVAPSATRYLIAHASQTIYQSNLAGAAIALSTVAATGNISMITAFGKAIFQDGLGNPWQWDGNSTSTLSGMPVGKYMLFADERVYVANVPSVSAAQVAVSSFGSSSYFTVPSNLTTNGDAPNSFNFQNDDGEGITCARVTPWGKVFGKRHSMWILKGYDNLTYYKRNVDPKIGCVDDRAMQMVDGLLVWLAVDGIYAWPGSGPPQLITKDILPTVLAIRQINAAAAQWIIDTQIDFQGGLITSNGSANSWDTLSTPGAIFPSRASIQYGNGIAWTTATLVNLSTSIVPGSLVPVQAGTGTFTNAGAESNSTSINWPSNTNWSNINSVGVLGENLYGSRSWQAGTADVTCAESVRISVLDISSNVLKSVDTQIAGFNPTFGNSSFSIDVSSLAYTYIKLRATYRPGASPISDMISAPFVRPQSLAFKMTYSGSAGNCQGVWDMDEGTMTLSGYVDSDKFETMMSTPVYGPFTVNQTSTTHAATTFSTRVATATTGTFDAAVAVTPGAQIGSLAKRALTFRMNYTLDSTTSTSLQVNAISLVALSTGIYYAPVHFIGTAISTFNAMNWTDAQSPTGLFNYYVRSASYTFAQDANSPSWTAQPNNTTILVATNTYFQWKVDSSSITSSSMTGTLFRAAANWQEGTSILMASGVLNHRFFICGMFAANATANDKCLILQKNNKWIPWAGPIPSAMGRYNDQLLVGDGSTNSYVWKIMQDGVYQDDGAPINAYWISKDFTLEKPYQQKILHDIWVDGVRTASSTLTVGYAVDKSSGYFNSTFNLDSSPFTVSHRVLPRSGFALGKYLKFKFANSLIDQYFEMNNYMFRAETKDIQNE